MGSFRVPIEIESPRGGSLVAFEALVDTGATYTWLPRDLVERLGITPEQRRAFVLADGRRAEYGIAWVRIRIDGLTQPTIVVLGEPGSEPLLGVVTLEEFGLAVDPLNRRLIHVPGSLKRAPLSPA